MAGLIRRLWALQHQTGALYSAVECTRAKVTVRNVVRTLELAQARKLGEVMECENCEGFPPQQLNYVPAKNHVDFRKPDPGNETPSALGTKLKWKLNYFSNWSNVQSSTLEISLTSQFYVKRFSIAWTRSVFNTIHKHTNICRFFQFHKHLPM